MRRKILIGVFPAGEREEADIEAFAQADGQEAQSGLLAGSVGIKEHDQALREAAELLHVLLRDGGALGGDCSRDAGRVAADGVELAFDEHERIGVLARHARAVDVEHRPGFLEQFSLGRVDVFRLAGRVVLWGDVERARGEGDDAPLDIADRDDEAAAETAAPAEWVGYAIDAEE